MVVDCGGASSEDPYSSSVVDHLADALACMCAVPDVVAEVVEALAVVLRTDAWSAAFAGWWEESVVVLVTVWVELEMGEGMAVRVCAG